jgi:CspA family cold shock protein
MSSQAMNDAPLTMSKGTVKWFNEKKGFGFILDPKVQSDIFVHFSAIQSDGFKTLQEGDLVEYELYTDEKGAKARNVVRVTP